MTYRARIQTWRLILPLLAVLAAGTALALTVDGDIRPPEIPASGSASLKYLPKDYWFVGEADLRTVMDILDSPQARNNPQFAPIAQALKMVHMMTGVDPMKEVDSITLFAAGNPDEKPKPLVCVKGVFDNGKVTDSLRLTLAKDMAESTYKDKTILSNEAGGLYFPEASTVLYGDVDLLKHAIDAQKAGAQPLPPSLKNLLDRTNGQSAVWVAFKPKTILGMEPLTEWNNQNAELSATLKKIECLSLAFSLTLDGLLINATGVATAGNDGKAIRDYLSQRKSDLLQKEGVNVVFASLLVLSDVTSGGPYVQGSFRLTATALMQLWQTKMVVKP